MSTILEMSFSTVVGIPAASRRFVIFCIHAWYQRRCSMRSVLRTTAGFCERSNCNALPKSQLDQSGPAPACVSCSLLLMRSRVCLSFGSSPSASISGGTSSIMISSVSSSSNCSGMGASACVGSAASVRRGSLG